MQSHFAKLKIRLHQLSMRQKHTVAYSFALHVAWLLNEHPAGSGPYQKLLTMLPEYINGSIILNQVAAAYVHFNQHYTTFGATGVYHRVAQIDADARIAAWALYFVCGETLRHNGYINITKA